MEIVGFVVGVIGLTAAGYFGWKLRQWEKHLSHARIAIAYKGKVKMDPRLIDWVHWSRMLAKDKRNTGQSVYKMGGTTVAILDPIPRHSKTKTRTVREKRAA